VLEAVKVVQPVEAADLEAYEEPVDAAHPAAYLKLVVTVNPVGVGV
jgi:L-alanine-DL-glutamate epimerase-like enolase superfamily enzyme